MSINDVIDLIVNGLNPTLSTSSHYLFLIDKPASHIFLHILHSTSRHGDEFDSLCL